MATRYDVKVVRTMIYEVVANTPGEAAECWGIYGKETTTTWWEYVDSVKVIERDVCEECKIARPGDERVQVGMKCTECSY